MCTYNHSLPEDFVDVCVNQLSLKGKMNEALNLWSDAYDHLDASCIADIETYHNLDPMDSDDLEVIAHNAATIDDMPLVAEILDKLGDQPKLILSVAKTAFKSGSDDTFVFILDHYSDCESQIYEEILSEMKKDISSSQMCLYPPYTYNEEIYSRFLKSHNNPSEIKIVLTILSLSGEEEAHDHIELNSTMSSLSIW